MHLLVNTSHILRLVSGSAGSLACKFSVMENNAGTITPVAPANQVITTAATTTLVGSPSSGVQRNIKSGSITNNSGSVSNQITVQDFDGTTSSDLFTCLLLPGERAVLDELGVWHHYDAQGGEYTYAGPSYGNLGATGTLAETMARELCPEINTTAGASGTLFLQAIYLKAGTLVSNITVWSATTAAATTSNLFFALYDGSRNLLAQSANQGAYTWAANSKKTLAMTTAYRVTVSGVYYIGVLQVATTIATLKGGTAKTGGQLAADAPILQGTSSTGLTTSLPNPAAAITGGTASIYAAVS